MRHSLTEAFSDGKYLSWTRIFATPTLICALYGFIYSIMSEYETGCMYSVAIITLVFGLKSYQNHTETKLQNKIISEVSKPEEECGEK